MKRWFWFGMLVAVASVCARASYAQCVGDCDDSGDVDVSEVLVGVGIALGDQEVDECDEFDVDGNDSVEVNELVTGLDNNLGGCVPTGPTDTPTPTGSTEPTLSPTPTRTESSEPTSTPVVCNFGGAGNSLTICLQDDTCLTAAPPSGEIGISCGPTGTDGVRECSCLFRQFNEINLIGVGLICITEPRDAAGNAVECPLGRQDCDGGSPSSIDVVANSEGAGSCPQGNAQCASLCDAYCASLEPAKVRFNSGCESFCQGGDRADMPCECDSPGAGGCDPASTLFCPAGSCEGQNNEITRSPDFDANDCHCQCIQEGIGTDSPAGAFRCRLPTNIRVENNPPCGGGDVLIQLPPLCAPLTTETHTAIVMNANESSTALIEGNLMGNSISCEELDSGAPTGMRLLTNLPFFDSTIGDLVSQLVLQCQ